MALEDFTTYTEYGNTSGFTINTHSVSITNGTDGYIEKQFTVGAFGYPNELKVWFDYYHFSARTDLKTLLWINDIQQTASSGIRVENGNYRDLYFWIYDGSGRTLNHQAEFFVTGSQNYCELYRAAGSTLTYVRRYNDAARTDLLKEKSAQDNSGTGAELADKVALAHAPSNNTTFQFSNYDFFGATDPSAPEPVGASPIILSQDF